MQSTQLAKMVTTATAIAAAAAAASLALGAGAKVGRGAKNSALAEQVTFADYLDDLDFVTDFRWLPDGRMVITQKSGELKVRRPDGSVVTAATFPVDSGSEKGLLGVEVDPDFVHTRRLFLYYSLANRAGGTNADRHRVVSVVLAQDDTVDITQQKVLLRGLRGPANHDGGALVIGPDGKLYVGVGDTGCNSGQRPDPPYEPTNYFATCQNLGNGKILRINLDGSIPADNPLVGVGEVTACSESCHEPVSAERKAAPRTEIWAWGFRNPWRLWFDPQTHKLWAGDVGEITYEEIDIVEKGKHYGWPWREGTHGWPATRCKTIAPDAGECVDPIYECSHGEGEHGTDGDCQSITGGVILDHCSWPDAFRGHYLFADNGNGRVWLMTVTPKRDGLVPGSREQLTQYEGLIPVTVREGPDGAAYFAIYPSKIVRMAPKQPAVCHK